MTLRPTPLVLTPVGEQDCDQLIPDAGGRSKRLNIQLSSCCFPSFPNQKRPLGFLRSPVTPCAYVYQNSDPAGTRVRLVFPFFTPLLLLPLLRLLLLPCV